MKRERIRCIISGLKIGKAMFQQIANEELERCGEHLKQLHQRWEKNEKWPETIPLKISKCLFVKTFLRI